MNPTWLKIFELVLGTAETVVPIFIHNPNSQKVEGVIVSTLPGVIQGLGGVTPPKS
jgi:hypothetical protein